MTTEPPEPIFIHDTAIVEAGAVLGAGTQVWHHAHVRSDAVIGRGCTLGKGVYIDQGVTIGDRVKIQNHVSVYVGVTLQDDIMVGPSACFTNDLRPRSGDGWQVTPTLVKSGVGIGANATIVCGATIGRWAMIGAGTVVVGDVPDHALVVGNPSRVIGWVDEHGETVSRQATRPEELGR